MSREPRIVLDDHLAGGVSSALGDMADNRGASACSSAAPCGLASAHVPEGFRLTRRRDVDDGECSACSSERASTPDDLEGIYAFDQLALAAMSRQDDGSVERVQLHDGFASKLETRRKEVAAEGPPERSRRHRGSARTDLPGERGAVPTPARASTAAKFLRDDARSLLEDFGATGRRRGGAGLQKQRLGDAVGLEAPSKSQEASRAPGARQRGDTPVPTGKAVTRHREVLAAGKLPCRLGGRLPRPDMGF